MDVYYDINSTELTRSLVIYMIRLSLYSTTRVNRFELSLENAGMIEFPLISLQYANGT